MTFGKVCATPPARDKILFTPMWKDTSDLLWPREFRFGNAVHCPPILLYPPTRLVAPFHCPAIPTRLSGADTFRLTNCLKRSIRPAELLLLQMRGCPDRHIHIS